MSLSEKFQRIFYGDILLACWYPSVHQGIKTIKSLQKIGKFLKYLTGENYP
jgi:hypothetical protein